MAAGWFYLCCLALGSLGSLCILFTAYWMRYWRGGFAWDGTVFMFNWHPVLMVAGMVVLYGAASLVYRLPQSWLGPKLPWKLLHAALHLAAFTLTVLGLFAVFQFHQHGNIANLYSLHSWLGITTVFLFACQWLLGFAIFLLPWASTWLRSILKPIHVFFGVSILSLAVASVISGINEKLFFSFPCCMTESEAGKDSRSSWTPLRSSSLPGAPIKLWVWTQTSPCLLLVGPALPPSWLPTCPSL
ncbi:lysosomal membrane ascorbate-dependent ferrireductase CYB561A3 isoform X1 [Talpa occidentalis]|uniref:lysosomal membrane ascorbate-dependent ferrireductase CYB561A3 isoform X1 n=1 Tax=Talpa occidentalis TaxID=50954 RepID=UPI00188E0EEF|nr:lysosomal membrane ascorbate-dependent ferrireductase CYB561A3 isoform X1 [Talpa occidentalis]XP_037373679.1 lysosomal membrane ascorbate-dependent ferrireductase CYB561A3 isoform X1 [Talpa occidentalis]XP_037373681.1 lysosomal membrane ascorbate-dependent ferrireductase CYB561A3 isoform X1 [Talpa occidentalis]XP_037373682.1 lysosomal membrane ascorbate-dependent ferrireductase CYB561A3 isoform X1 [Talpa occidentalis]XP_037373683.1 lysosomal membrane ascorbate-dependent ferrireductase CYB561